MTEAMKAQPRWELLDRTEVYYAGGILLVVGTVLVVSSFLVLGFTGTFLGECHSFNTYERSSYALSKGNDMTIEWQDMARQQNKTIILATKHI